MDQFKNGILIDYLRCTIHDVSLERVKDLLELSGAVWQEDHGFHGYPRRIEFHHIALSYGYDDPAYFGGDVSKIRTNMGINLQMSGEGCRAFETHSKLSWVQLFTKLRSLGVKVKFTRIDLAYDDHEGVLDINQIADDLRNEYLTCKAHYYSVINSRDQLKNTRGLTCYIGRKSSPVYICIYNKAAEREFTDEDRHWVRVELRIGGERADPCADLIVDRQDPGVIFSGVLRNYCCFRTPSGDSNKSRWPVAPYWQRLIDGSEAMRLWLAPGEDYNILKSRDHLLIQYGQALLLLDELHAAGGIYGLLADARKLYPVLGKKYQAAIDEYKKEAAAARERVQQLRKELGLDDFTERRRYDRPYAHRIYDSPGILDNQLDLVDLCGDQLANETKNPNFVAFNPDPDLDEASNTGQVT